MIKVLNLIKMEFKKIEINKIFRTFTIINIAILGIIWLINLDIAEGEFNNYTELFSIIEILIGATFVVYASVLLSKLIIDEFRQKTITILFMYPIDRKKLLLSKLIIVSALTFCFVIISDILVTLGFYFINKNLNFIAEPLTTDIVANQLLHLVVYAASCAGLALIPLFFGMIKKSVSTTIVSSILIVTLLNSGDGGNSLGSVIAVPISLGIIGFIIAYMTISKAVKADL